MRQKLLKALPIAAAILAANLAHATVTVYTDKASYMAAISNPWTNTLDNLPYELVGTSLGAMSGSYFYGYQVDGVGGYYVNAAGDDHFLQTVYDRDKIDFVYFAGPIHGLGGYFYGVNGAGQANGSTITIKALDTKGQVLTQIVNSGSGTFFGFTTDEVFARITISSASGSYAAMNDITVGALPVPEPASYGMMAAGLAMLACLKRRKA
jgi:hypothetical protein